MLMYADQLYHLQLGTEQSRLYVVLSMYAEVQIPCRLVQPGDYVQHIFCQPVYLPHVQVCSNMAREPALYLNAGCTLWDDRQPNGCL